MNTPLDPRFFRQVPFKSRFMAGLLLIMTGLCLGHPMAQAAGGGSIRISSSQQIYKPFEGITAFDGGVKIAMEGTQIEAPHADIRVNSNGQADTAVFTNRAKLTRKTDGGLKQVIQADTLNMGLTTGAMNAQGKVSTNITGDEKVGNLSIQSDTQAFDQEKGIMRAIGHVTVVKDDMTIKSPEALFLMGPTGAAEKAVFIKGAHLVQGEQEMEGENITIFINSGNINAEKHTRSVVMGKDKDGKPTKIVIRSHLQEIDNNSGTLLANGNAVVDYDDYIARGPKAVFYRKNNELDRIVMTGRAQVEDPERKVTGDTVVITVNPRQFNAQGNVTTFIKAKKKPAASNTASAPGGHKPASGSGKPAASQAAAAPAAKPSTQAWEEEEMLEAVTRNGVNPEQP